MLWQNVASFSQPSPIDQILDKDEFTLEELLDEDDIVQDCKSLNGRLVAFLRERSTVEQLLRFLVEPAKDLDDPKRTYKYPFTSCEVLCCELEAIFNTLLEDAELMALLFSLLDAPPPLCSKAAGYFGRVVGTLLLRKGNEMVKMFQDNPYLLEKLASHIDTTSVADVVKRMVGADEACSSQSEPSHAQWLSEAKLVDLLLAKLAHSASADAQANAANILSVIANTQPSPLAVTLSQEESIACLFDHALLSPGKQVMVSAIEVCIALLEPHRISTELEQPEENPVPAQDSRIKEEAVKAILQHLPKLVELLRVQPPGTEIQTTYGVLAPRLGLPRLKITELLVVLIRSGGAAAEDAVMLSGAIPVCLELFQAHPYNNMLHHNVAAMLLAALTQSSESFLSNLFQQCSFLDWLVSLPVNVTVPEKEQDGPSSPSSSKNPIRAGYLGHVTQIGGIVDSISQQGQPCSSEASAVFTFIGDVAHPARVAEFVQGHAGWQTYSDEMLRPRLTLENTAHWVCGRPAAGEPPGLDSDGDDFSVEQISGMQPALEAMYHRYNSVHENDDDEEEEEADRQISGAELFGLSDTAPLFSAMGLGDHGDGVRYDEDGNADEAPQSSGRSNPTSEVGGQQGMDDDSVLLASSDDEEAGETESKPAGASSPSQALSEPGGVQAAQAGVDDVLANLAGSESRSSESAEE